MFKAVETLLPPARVTSYSPDPLMYLHSISIAVGLFILYFFIIKDLRFSSKRIFQTALFSLFLKFLNAIGIQGLIFFGHLYEGGDSLYYDDMGHQILPLIRDEPVKFIFDYLTGTSISREGTMFSLTGILYYLTGMPSLLAASVVGAFVSSLGAYLFFKAYRLGFPQSGYHLYGYLIFLFPSLIFWTSQHLKEPWIFFYMGLMTYGSTLLLQRKWIKGTIYALVGFYMGFHIKAYLVFFILCSFGCPVLMVRMKPPVLAMLVKILILAGASYVMSRTFAIVDEVYLGSSSFFEQMSLVKNFSVRGGSAIELKSIDSLSQIGNLFYNLFSVLYRPLIFEARNPFTFFASLETTTLLALTLASLKSVWPFWKKPSFWFFLVAFTLMFSVAFSFQIGNLGTMMRIKVSLLPFLFMLFSYHLSPRKKKNPALSSCVLSNSFMTVQNASGKIIS